MRSTKIIIAGVPGIGKTKCEEILPGIADDLKCTHFQYVRDNIPNIIWPDNYIDLIKCLAFETDDIKDYRNVEYILISTHHEVLSNLRKYHVPFIIAVPEDMDCTDFHQYQMPILRVNKNINLFNILDLVSSYDYFKSKIEDAETYIFDAEEDPDDYTTEILKFMSKIGDNNYE